MVGFIPLRTEEQYLVPLVVILLVEYILLVTILHALQRNNTIFRGFNEGKVFNNFINSHGSFGGGVVLCVLRILITVMFLGVVGYHYVYQPVQLGRKQGEWSLYTQWSLLLVTFYFGVVSVMSIRKLHLNDNDSTTSPLIDPKLTKFASSLFSLSGNIALISSVFSLYEHKFGLVYIDHVVLATMLMEIFLNNFSVTVSDVFHSINFAYLYISVLFVVVVIFDARNWPHSLFRLRDRWCIARYNIFIFSHIFLFLIFYLLCNKVASCGKNRNLPKILPFTQPIQSKEEPIATTNAPFTRGEDEDEEGDIEASKPKRTLRHVKTMDEELEEQYCPNNKNTYGDPPPPGAGDLTESEEKELQQNVGKLSYQLNKQAEKYEKLKHQNVEKDIKLKQLEADLEAQSSRIAMLVSQQKSILDKRIETPVETFMPVEIPPPLTEMEMKKISGIVNCPGCEKEYQVNDDMVLVEVEEKPEVKITAPEIRKITEPFITEQMDKDYFRHVLLAELTKDSRNRAKKLGISIYYNNDVDHGKNKTYKLKKDLQNEIYLVCTGDLLYPSRNPETIKKEKEMQLLQANEEATEVRDQFEPFSSPLNKNLHKKLDSPGNTNQEIEQEKKKTRKIVFYRQKSNLRNALGNESIDEIRERASDLDIDIYDENGMLKLKKQLKAEIYGEMTGDSIYEDVHSMTRMNSQVLH